MKKNLFFLILFIGFLSLANASWASTITLPNPLCPAMAEPCVPSATCVCGFGDLITKIISYISTIIGALAVLMFVVAGIFFVISAGNPEKITTAKKIAIYAVIGLAIALVGAGLVQVIQEVIGANPPV